MEFIPAGVLSARMAASAWPALPDWPTIGVCLLGYVALSLSLGLIWICLVSAAHFYQVRFRPTQKTGFTANPRTPLSWPILRDQWVRDEQQFQQQLAYLDASVGASPVTPAAHELPLATAAKTPEAQLR
jgi:hypothetical protein